MNKINVTKMQGLGNDFVIVDYCEYEKSGLPMDELAKKLCDRNFGIGADGMIIPNLTPETQIIKNSEKKPISFTPDIGWFFYNSDGSTAQMCGNGIRCFAKYVYDRKLVNSKKFSVITLAGIIVPEILEDGQVRVNMSKPVLVTEKIPFNSPNVILNSLQDLKNEQPCDADTSSARRNCNEILNIPLQIDDKNFKINAISMGNPHCVIFVQDDQDLLELAKTYGPQLEKHELFPEKTNVEFAKIISKNEIDLRVFERGCGITLACGTGACATVVAAILNNLTDSKVKVNLLGGALTIEWQGFSDNTDFDIFMSGPAQYSFLAEYLL